MGEVFDIIYHMYANNAILRLIKHNPHTYSGRVDLVGKRRVMLNIIIIYFMDLPLVRCMGKLIGGGVVMQRLE